MSINGLHSDMKNVIVTNFPGIGIIIKADVRVDPEVFMKIWEKFLLGDDPKLKINIKIPYEMMI